MKTFRFSGRAAVVCSLILAIGVPSVAMGFGEGRSLLLGKRNPSSNAEPRAERRDRDHRRQLDLRHPPVQQARRRRRRRDLRLPLQPGQRALHPREQPQGRPRLRVRRPSARKAAGSRSATTTGAPFTTNATGVATGLNADQVDGKERDRLRARRPRLLVRDRVRLRHRPRPTGDRPRRPPTVDRATTGRRQRRRLHGRLQHAT